MEALLLFAIAWIVKVYPQKIQKTFIRGSMSANLY